MLDEVYSRIRTAVFLLAFSADFLSTSQNSEVTLQVIVFAAHSYEHNRHQLVRQFCPPQALTLNGSKPWEA